MDIYDFKNAFLIGFFMAFMIGPVFFMLIQTSILKGARAAIVFDLGVILGDLSFILIAYYGSRSLLEKIKDDPRLFFLGGLVLIIYGLITYLEKENKKEALESAKIVDVPIKNNYLKLFFKGYFLNFINIGVLAFWLGTILVIGPTLNMNQSAIFWYFATNAVSISFKTEPTFPSFINLGKSFLLMPPSSCCNCPIFSASVICANIPSAFSQFS